MKDLQTVLDALEATSTRLRTYADDPYSSIDFDESIDKKATEAIAIVRKMMQAEPVAWMHEGTLGRYFNENRNDIHSIPLYCASMTMDSDFIQIPVAYQYAYPDGEWRCSYGDPINGSRPITSRALYARKDGK